MHTIIPFLWFDGEAEEAANFYVSIFRNSRITGVTYYNEAVAAAAGQRAGSVLTVDFELDGQKIVALNGGPQFKFTEANSYMVLCDTQEEIDEKWEKLTEGGEPGYCGWLKDKFGLSWQIAPRVFEKMIHDSDPEKSARVMAAMMEMRKFDIAALERAYEGDQVRSR